MRWRPPSGSTTSTAPNSAQIPRASSHARLEAEIALETLFRRLSELRLAVPRDELEWRPTPGFRRVVALHVAWYPLQGLHDQRQAVESLDDHFLPGIGTAVAASLPELAHDTYLTDWPAVGGDECAPPD